MLLIGTMAIHLRNRCPVNDLIRTKKNERRSSYSLLFKKKKVHLRTRMFSCEWASVSMKLCDHPHILNFFREFFIVMVVAGACFGIKACCTLTLSIVLFVEKRSLF